MSKPTNPRPHTSAANGKVNQPTARPRSARPTAPPVYRPQPVPRCLQPKAATPSPSPAAPPVYRPQPAPKVLQRKASPVQPKNAFAAKTLPAAPQPRPRPASQALRPKTAVANSYATPKATPKNLPQARPALFTTAARPGVVQRAMDYRTPINDQATFLMGTASTLFTATKRRRSELMEVQSAIIGDQMVIASNYGGEGAAEDSALVGLMEDSYTHANKTYTGKKLTTITHTLHAEQQILKHLAKVIKNSKGASLAPVTIVGTKRPCSVCRRVLWAFLTALEIYYKKIKLHFVDETGADTTVDYLDLTDMKYPGVKLDEVELRFNNFVDAYTAALEKFKTKKFSGEDDSKSVRTNATPGTGDLIF